VTSTCRTSEHDAKDDLNIVITSYGPKVLDVLANDIRVNNGTIVSFTQPQYGTVSLDASGTALIYTPDADRNNLDESFTYTIKDTGGCVDTATVTLHVDCASSQTSDGVGSSGGDALGTMSMILMALMTAMAGLYFIRKEEERGEA